jgi:acetylornithine aminotransferase
MTGISRDIGEEQELPKKLSSQKEEERKQQINKAETSNKKPTNAKCPQKTRPREALPSFGGVGGGSQMELFNVYPLFDVNIVRGRGCKVWDDKGQEYLDLYGGHAVISIGHCHPHYVEMLTQQLGKLPFYSNSVINNLQRELAQRLGSISGYDDYQLFLINSGAEANENCLKLASFHNGRKRVLSVAKSFHGRTSLAVEATDNPKIVAPVNDNNHVTFLPMNDLEAWEQELAKGDVCACILECIQGVGGVNMATPEFAQGLEAACKQYGTVLICDEIQCGYGRSGKFFAHQWLGIRPDLISVAKGIGNGFPMGGVLISPRFRPVYGQLGTTFGGNHLACAAALAVLDVFEAEHLVENAHETGEYLIARLRELQRTQPHILEVRGRGLMIGIVLDVPQKDVRAKLIYNQHCFTGSASTNMLRILPPLCLTKTEADDFINRLNNVLSDL